MYLLLNSHRFNWLLLVYLFCPFFILKVLTRQAKTWQRKRSSHFKQYWARSLGWYASYSSQTVQMMRRSVELNIAERCGKQRISPLEFFQLLFNQKQSHPEPKDWCEETNGHPDEYLHTPRTARSLWKKPPTQRCRLIYARNATVTGINELRIKRWSFFCCLEGLLGGFLWKSKKMKQIQICKMKKILIVI